MEGESQTKLGLFWLWPLGEGDQLRHILMAILACSAGTRRTKNIIFQGKQHRLGARIPLPDKCGEMICQEGLVAVSSPLLPGAAQHPVSHPEQLTLIFRSLHTGDGCCILPINAVGGDGNNVGNGTMVAEGIRTIYYKNWKIQYC